MDSAGQVLLEVGKFGELVVFGEDVTRGVEDLDSGREAGTWRGEEQYEAVVGRVLDRVYRSNTRLSG